MLLRDLLGDGQAQARTGRLGRIVHLEYTIQAAGINTPSGIFEFNVYVGTPAEGVQGQVAAVPGRRPFRGNRQRAAAFHGIEGVEHDVQHQLLDLVDVDGYHQLAVPIPGDDPDAPFPGRALVDLYHLVEYRVDVVGERRQFGRPGVVEEILDETVDTPDLRDHLFVVPAPVLLVAVLLLHVPLENPEVDDHGIKRIADFVGQYGGELAQRSQALGLFQAAFLLHQLAGHLVELAGKGRQFAVARRFNGMGQPALREHLRAANQFVDRTDDLPDDENTDHGRDRCADDHEHADAQDHVPRPGEGAGGRLFDDDLPPERFDGREGGDHLARRTGIDQRAARPFAQRLADGRGGQVVLAVYPVPFRMGDQAPVPRRDVRVAESFPLSLPELNVVHQVPHVLQVHLRGQVSRVLVETPHGHGDRHRGQPVVRDEHRGDRGAAVPREFHVGPRAQRSFEPGGHFLPPRQVQHGQFAQEILPDDQVVDQLLVHRVRCVDHIHVVRGQVDDAPRLFDVQHDLVARPARDLEVAVGHRVFDRTAGRREQKQPDDQHRNGGQRDVGYEQPRPQSFS